jgi:hypothetical protein
MSKRDCIILSGLALIGVGLFFSYGLGAALAVPGALIFLMGCLTGVKRR